MKIAITGSESFIGKVLKQQCRAQKIDFVGFDTVPSKDREHHVLDIRSPDIHKKLPPNLDAIVHLAAISRDEDCRKNPKLAFEVNVGGTQNLIEAAKKQKVRQFIFASSEWVYGEVANEAIQREDGKLDASKIKSEYALTKIEGEGLLQKIGKEDGMNVTIMRFGIVYGPRPSNWSAVETLFNAVKAQNEIEVGSLKTARRFIHVSDIAGGILSSLGRKGVEIFNLSGNHLISLKDIIEESKMLLKKNPKVIEKNSSAVSIRNPDNQKARDILGWSPVITLKQGLKTLSA